MDLTDPNTPPLPRLSRCCGTEVEGQIPNPRGYYLCPDCQQLSFADFQFTPLLSDGFEGGFPSDRLVETMLYGQHYQPVRTGYKGSTELPS